MKEIGLAIEGGLLVGCLLALLSVALCVIVAHFARGWMIWRSKRTCVFMSLLALVATYVGGTKPTRLYIVWDEGLHDNGSYIDTNDLRRVVVNWTYDNWIPSVASFTLSAIPNTSNPDPSVDRTFVIGTCPITNRTFVAYMETEATNYTFFAEQSYIPDVPVVTNGVYHVHCVGGTNVWVPIGIEIKHQGETISPPESYLQELTGGN